MEWGRRREGQARTRGLLLQLLEGACGTREKAASMLRLALAQAAIDDVPDAPERVLLFVRAHLLGKLGEEVGPRAAMGLIDDLVERLDEPPDSGVIPVPPPSSASRIAGLSVHSTARPARGILLIVDDNALRRASTARPLVTAGWDVRTALSKEEVLDVAGEGENPTAIVVSTEHASMEAILRVSIARWPGAAVVVHGDVAEASASLLDFLLEQRQVRICSRDEPLRDRVDALVEALRGNA